MRFLSAAPRRCAAPDLPAGDGRRSSPVKEKRSPRGCARSSLKGHFPQLKMYACRSLGRLIALAPSNMKPHVRATAGGCYYVRWGYIFPAWLWAAASQRNRSTDSRKRTPAPVVFRTATASPDAIGPLYIERASLVHRTPPCAISPWRECRPRRTLGRRRRTGPVDEAA